MRDSYATAPQRYASYVVYEKATGRVAHLFHVELMEGASAPPQTKIERDALISASRASHTKEASLGLLAISPSDIKPRTKYAVDLKTLTLRKVKTGEPRSRASKRS
jgi:hypothetical protein